MEEVINEIVEFAKKKTGDFTYSDQALIYEELSSRMSDLNCDSLRNEYLGDNDYLIDGV